MHSHISFRAGLKTLDAEFAAAGLEAAGTVPAWLDGALLRTGPAKFEVGDTAYRHWFDGLAMLHRFAFSNGAITYSNRFLESDSYLKAKAKGAIAVSEFATDVETPFWKKILPIIGQAATDNANVNVVAYGENDFVALTETPRPVRFDPETLATLGHFQWAEKAGGKITTAHPQYDPVRRLIYNFEIVLGRKSSYRIYQMSPGTGAAKVIAEIGTDRPAYIHSFAMSEKHIVLVEFPLAVQPLQLLFGGQPYIETYRWLPERGSRFTVVEKDSGKIVKQVTGEPCFAFHHINAYEEDGTVVVDLAHFPDPAIMNALYLDQLRGHGSMKPGTYTRYRIPLGAGALEERRISDVPVEFPRIHYARDAGHKHRFVWGASQEGDFIDTVVKFDLDTGEVLKWRSPGCFPGEPVFVPDPKAGSADQGVLLCVVLDGVAQRSCLVVLDAVSLTELARAILPVAIPFGFHGNFFNAN